MSTGSLITMIIILGLTFGGMIYFLNIAFTSEDKKGD
ncbi:MetS family NSS transporter small subunit [Calorimonas adulescens]|uniref:MetS family NSS transporter small subunit n=1 Tax=Calorimonas adulescens TaxID=2606906 RepID=A0A5D8QFY3_9THEO|nr:MetS family NSS transporter small subunit [Calorimonas adulescens]TZE82756.1 MetS family NSS transporter small subunit [Calorimonas adulescens]